MVDKHEDPASLALKLLKETVNVIVSQPPQTLLSETKFYSQGQVLSLVSPKSQLHEAACLEFKQIILFLVYFYMQNDQRFFLWVFSSF